MLNIAYVRLLVMFSTKSHSDAIRIRLILALGVVGALIFSILPAISAFAFSGSTMSTVEKKVCSDNSESRSDVVFVIDESGSMKRNDPQFARRTAITTFVDELSPGERVGIVGFDGSVRHELAPTTDRTMIDYHIEQINSVGDTNISAGFETALSFFTAEDERRKFIVLLTDGEGTYDKTLTRQAVSKGVVVMSVSIGGSGAYLIQAIAEATGGQYLLAQRAEDLVDVFAQIRESTKIECDAPLVEAGGPYEVAEGGSVTLTGAAHAVLDLREPTDLAWDLDGNGKFDIGGATTTFDASTLDGPGEHTVTFRGCNPDGACATDTATVRIVNVNPEVDLGPNLTTRPGQAVTITAAISDSHHDSPYDISWSTEGADVNTIAADSRSAELTYNTPGTYQVSLTATDKDGASHRDEITVHVTPHNPVCTAANPSITSLTAPPRPKSNYYEPVTIHGVTQQEGIEPTITIVAIHQDEPNTSLRVFSSPVDADGIGTSTALLRPERDPIGDGRVYHITFSAAVDGAAPCVGTVTVEVPRWHNKNIPAVDGGPRFDSTMGHVYPNPGENTTNPWQPAAGDQSVASQNNNKSKGKGNRHVANPTTPAADVFTAAPGETLVVTADQLRANDTVPEGLQPVTKLAVLPSGADLVAADDGTFTFAAHQAGTYVASYYLENNGQISNAAAITFVVAEPAASVTAHRTPHRDLVTAEDQPVTTDLVVRGATEPAQFEINNQPEHGTVSIDGAHLTYTPAENYTGTDTFTYSSTLGDITQTATVNINVLASNDTPSADRVTATGEEDHTITVDLTATDTEDTTLDVSMLGTSYGVASLEGTTLTLTPPANYTGPIHVWVKATDSANTFTIIPVNVTIHEMNDPSPTPQT